MLLSNKFRLKASTRPAPREHNGLWDDLRESLRIQFPNPQRHGCPERGILEDMARRKLPLQDAEKWMDHLGQCSPCFQDFEAIKAQRARYGRRWAWATATAAGVALCAALVLAVSYRNTFPRPHVPATDSTQPSVDQPQLATLNLEHPYSTRGIEPGSGSLHLPRAPLALSIYLSEDSVLGNYNVELLVNPADRQYLVAAQGQAKRVDRRTVLRLQIDLSHLNPGTYVIAFRPAGGNWLYSRVEIS